ncbi:DegT/DnrJ/EryC1/StrS family aminotransferase [Paenibacillus sp. GCM10027626]|uniref:DegT/DnrJ/EryC1/StrS family aminotransferase n=1 Tax=Paenibacillus sp. GCM10027626 TaxID=3273411 RepID=UPI0036341F17
MTIQQKQQLALFGGTPAVTAEYPEMFHWPIITEEDEAAALDVLRKGAMSGTDITRQFEREFAAWMQTDYALGFNTGTASIHAAMFACKIGVGDEVICPSLTYWATLLQMYSLGATPIFAEVDKDSLCLDPDDIEHRITDRTKAIMVVHYVGYPADMDRIMAIARKHQLKVIEDVSHAQGSRYKGRMLGTIGDVGAMSLMSGKAFAIGEAGILVTDDREIFERAIAFAHYERYNNEIETEDLRPFIGLPLGGYKYRMHQVSSAVGRVQLKYYEQRIDEISRAMNYFWDQLEGLPGIRAHRTTPESGNSMGGFYNPLGKFISEELGGLSVTRFCEAVRAEGVPQCYPGCNLPLHLHPIFHDADIYGHGRPTRIAHVEREIREKAGSLPVTEQVNMRVFNIPWFKHMDKQVLDQYVNAFRKVIANYELLLEGDPGNPERIGNWNLTPRKKIAKS